MWFCLMIGETLVLMLTHTQNIRQHDTRTSKTTARGNEVNTAKVSTVPSHDNAAKILF